MKGKKSHMMHCNIIDQISCVRSSRVKANVF
jgi:hypothetical protein